MKSNPMILEISGKFGKGGTRCDDQDFASGASILGLEITTCCLFIQDLD